jgi:hypothetical protein
MRSPPTLMLCVVFFYASDYVIRPALVPLAVQ